MRVWFSFCEGWAPIADNGALPESVGSSRAGCTRSSMALEAILMFIHQQALRVHGANVLQETKNLVDEAKDVLS